MSYNTMHGRAYQLERISLKNGLTPVEIQCKIV